jgi:hypothetical protein
MRHASSFFTSYAEATETDRTGVNRKVATWLFWVAMFLIAFTGYAVADPGDDITMISVIPNGAAHEPDRIDGGWMRDPLSLPVLIVTLPRPGLPIWP